MVPENTDGADAAEACAVMQMPMAAVIAKVEANFPFRLIMLVRMRREFEIVLKGAKDDTAPERETSTTSGGH